MASKILRYELLVRAGCPLTFDEFCKLHHHTKSHVIVVDGVKIKGSMCSAQICGFIGRKTNIVHCVGCPNDPHHRKSHMRNMFYCPICEKHFPSELRCVNDCNDCQEHGGTCIYFEGDISCEAKECVMDKHHRNKYKKNHALCKYCNTCHGADRSFCSICNLCINNVQKSHCTVCFGDPHHTLSSKESGQKPCDLCMKCHSSPNYRYCVPCNTCKKTNQDHCTLCHHDPHHETVARRDYAICEACNLCHPKHGMGFCSSCKGCFKTLHCFKCEVSDNDPHHNNGHRLKQLFRNCFFLRYMSSSFINE